MREFVEEIFDVIRLEREISVKIADDIELQVLDPLVSGPETVDLGRELSIEEGYRAARICGLSVLATLRDALGSLDKIKRIVAVTGYVSATDDFKDHPKVLNGASDLFVEIFGEQGRQARTAVGVSSLPLGLAVEIEVIVEC